VITLASEPAPGRSAVDTLGTVLGLLVFVAGIAMIIWTFAMVQGIFQGIDEQMLAVRTASPQAATASGESEGTKSVTVAPGQGPSFASVGMTIGLQMLGLLVLGWLGALVAARGAHLAGACRGRRE